MKNIHKWLKELTPEQELYIFDLYLSSDEKNKIFKESFEDMKEIRPIGFPDPKKYDEVL